MRCGRPQMESALQGLAVNAKTNVLKEAIAQAKETLKNGTEKQDTPLSYIREKLLNAFEVAFDCGNEKTQHYAVEGLQHLLRDRRFHSNQIENPQDGLPAQMLHSLNGISHWNHKLQCHCLTVIVELICSTELKISLVELQTALELCMRVFGGSREDSARMSARAAVSQSISSYSSNRYGQSDEPQNLIAVYMDATSLLEGYVSKLDQLTTSSEQAVVVFDATNALLSAQPLSIRSHTPFVNLLWEKLCPLMIRLLGIPDHNVPSTVRESSSTDEPVGQGQIAKFPLSPAVLANPEATRALYLIVEQLLRLMCGIPSLNSVLEALFHKAFLFPKIEQRSEAIKIIRKMLADPKRLNDLIECGARSGSLSLWRMVIVCLAESANPQYDISIEAVRAVISMSQGILEYCVSDTLMKEETRKIIREMFPTLADVKSHSFSPLSREISMSRNSTDESVLKTERMRSESASSRHLAISEEADDEDEISCTMQKLAERFRIEQGDAGRGRESTDSTDHVSEGATAKRFVDELFDQINEWKSLKSTINVDEAILQFASKFYNEFNASHDEIFKRKAKVQQEFLNTDALYLTVYVSLSLAYRRDSSDVTWRFFKETVLSSGCIVYASESWLREVFDLIKSRSHDRLFASCHSLVDVIRDFDGLDRNILSDVDRLQKIERGPEKQKPLEERIAARWLICSAWESIVSILSTFLGVKERRKARQKVLDGIEYSIDGMQKLAAIALELELGERCGWIFENLVESSCDVEELRSIASAEEQKRLSIVSRIDLLSIQLVLDNAQVAIHSPSCWKHVIRCTEYVWELEKFIYGALCYEKPSMFSFGRKKEVEKERNRAEEGLPVADRSVEAALGERALDRDNISKTLCVLIAKTDRIYSTVGRQLSLKSLREMIFALCSASENRIFYSGQRSPSLTLPASLIGRVTECLSSLPSRPLSHQMLIWPSVSQHFVQVACGSEDESRFAISSLQDCVSALLSTETIGSCFNQMLLAPFQTIVCSDVCSTETRCQLVDCLSDFVRLRSDRVGSGWKPLFGALRAVKTAERNDSEVLWTVLDIISAYLTINKSSVLSWSLPDCIPCIVHFLQRTTTDGQSTEGEETIEVQLSNAALKLVGPVYSVIRNLYLTPHLPNHNLLHRMDLRATSSEEVETRVECLADSADLVSPLSTSLDPTFFLLRPGDPSPGDLEKTLDVPFGRQPWESESPHQTSALELLLEFVEQLAGVLVTAPTSVQSALLTSLHDLISDIRRSELGPAPAAFCLSSLILPHIQKWLRRSTDSMDPPTLRNLKHAIGICTEIAVDFLQNNPGGAWETRLLCDVLRLTTECSAQPCDASRVGAACLRHFETVFSSFEFTHWTILVKAIWDTCSVTLHPLRLLLSLFLSDGEDEGGDLGEVYIEGDNNLPIRQKMLAEQVFQLDVQRENNNSLESDEAEEGVGDVTIVIIKDGTKHRLTMSHLISSLLAHQIVLQLISSLVAPDRQVPDVLRGVISGNPSESLLNNIPNHIRTSLYHCLDASFQAARDLDARGGARALLSKALRLKDPNLYKQMVASAAAKMFSMFHLAEQRIAQSQDEALMLHFANVYERAVSELERVERRTAFAKLAEVSREHREEQFEFILVENGESEGGGERMYRLVSQNQLNETLKEYKKQRPQGLPTKKLPETRKNPFVAAMSHEKRNSKENNEIPSLATLRLISLREVCSLPANLLLQSPLFTQCYPLLGTTVIHLIKATPDFAVRILAIKYIEKLADENRMNCE